MKNKHLLVSSLFACHVSLFTAAVLPDTVITVNVENAAVQRYLQEVYYVNREDPSLINDYNVEPPSRRDIPVPAVVPLPQGEAEELSLVYGDSDDFSGWTDTLTAEKGTKELAVYNLIPQCTYYFKILDGEDILRQGEIHTEGQMRMIYVPGANNIRDLGGWFTADGRRVKYGKLYRGTELNGGHPVDSADVVKMKHQLGIGAELDMRAWYNVADDESNYSVFGFQADMYGSSDYEPYYFTYDSGQLYEHLFVFTWQYRWRRQFSFILNNLKLDRNVYFHCVWGGDRTGFLALFLEGLLGVDYDGLVKDYETTSFISPGRTKDSIEAVLDTIKTLQGSTLQEQFNTFFLKTIKSTQAEIDSFRELMLEDVDGGETTGISAFREDEAIMPEATYDLRGRKVNGRGHRGIVIQRDPDGRTRKVIK